MVRLTHIRPAAATKIYAKAILPVTPQPDFRNPWGEQLHIRGAYRQDGAAQQSYQEELQRVFGPVKKQPEVYREPGGWIGAAC
jgi:hypothetical protein